MSFITDILAAKYANLAEPVYDNSFLIQYLSKKTVSVDRSSKARSSFANIYAIYVLIEDYVSNGFLNSDKSYSNYSGMVFSKALARIRQLPFGAKIQNHALNNRCNDEFRKFFHEYTDEIPIHRDLSTQRYWINETLLKVSLSGNKYNIAEDCLEIIKKYIDLKRENFSSFFEELERLKKTVSSNPKESIQYLANTIKPSSDARIFEIVSFVVLKYYYLSTEVQYRIGYGEVVSEPLTLYKAGRTNANDGGIDYIMIPLGRVFQVTEVLDFKKYFLDIDKLEHYPITFVIKQNLSPKEAFQIIKTEASSYFSNNPTIVNSYLSCFKEIITIPTLLEYLETNIKAGYLDRMIDELICQCKVEYNFDE